MSWKSYNGLIQKLQVSQDDARIVEISTETSPSRAIKSDFEDDQKRWLIVGICLHSVIAPALRTYIPPFLTTLYNKLKQSHQIHQQTYPNQLKRYRPTNKELSYEAINNNATVKVRGKKDEPKYDYKVTNSVDLSKLFLQTHMAHYNAFDDTCDSSALLGILIGLDVFPPLAKRSAEKVRADIRNAWAHCNFTEWDIIKYQTTFQMMHQFIRNLVLPLQDETAILGKLTRWETNGIQFLHGTTLGLELVEELKTETGAIARYLRDVVKHTDDSVNDLHTAILDIDNSLGQLKNQILKLYGTSAQLTSDIKTVKDNVEGLNLTTNVIIQKQEIHGSTIQKMKTGLQEVETKMSEACSKAELEILRNDLKNTKTNVDKNRTEIDAISKYVSHARSSDKIFFYPPNRLRSFIGRDDEIDELMQCFVVKSSEHSLQVICGLGGTGKTSIAIELAWRYQNFYPGGVFWMSAESNEVLEDSFQRLSIDVDTVGCNAKETMYKTLKWLSSIQERWLLVIDNVDMEEIRGSMKELILGPWKRQSNGHILITSRRESSLAIEEFNTCATDCLTLEALSNHESKTFMQVRLGIQLKTNDENLDELVEELGGLPLALEQAAAHIKGLKCSFREYLEKFRQKRLKLLKAVKAPYDVSKERQTVRTTWQLNFDYIERQSEDEGLGNAAKTVMNVISFLFPDDIPLDLINVGSPEICFEDLRDILYDNLGSKQIVEILTRFSLFQWRDGNSVSVHRLVQEVIRDSLKSSDELQKILLCAIRMVNYALKQQPTPNDAVKEDNIGRTSLKHWNRLSYHASSLKAHLFGSTLKKDLKTICFNIETAKILQTTAIYHSLAQRQDQAMEAQDQMLNVLTAVDVSEKEFSDLTAIKIPLMNQERLIIQSAMTSLIRCEINNGEFEKQSSVSDLELLRTKGNDAFRSNQYMAAIQYYTEAIVESLEVVDPKLLANRSISYLRAGDYDNALRDADSCIQLDPKFWKGYYWKAFAISELVKVGRLPQSWESVGLAAASVAGHLNERCLLEFRMKIEYPIVRFILIEKEEKLGFEIASLKNRRYTTLLLRNGRYKISSERGEVTTKSVQIIGIENNVEIISSNEIDLIHPPSSAFSIKFVTEPKINVYFENIIFPKETGQIFIGSKVSATFYKCTFLNGIKGCEDFSYCRGGQGCMSSDRNTCKIKTENYEKGMDISGGGIAGSPGVCVGSTKMAGGKAFFQNCLFDRCGGGGILCEGKGSQTEMKNCVSKNMIQMGAEARYGGSIVADNCIFMDNQSHGVAIGPRGYGLFTNCTIQGNKKEGFWCGRVVGVQEYQYDSSGQPQIGGSSCSIRDSIICQNGMCGISLEGGSYDISGNKIFENWMWGVIAKARSSTNITNNDIFENKCGGLRLGPNYSASIFLDGNSIRDHSGPGVHVEKVPENVSPRSLQYEGLTSLDQQLGIPSDEVTCYSLMPIMTNRNVLKDNNRGFQHPKKLITVLQTCCCCHRMWNDLKSCAKCKKAKYCSKNCQAVHWQRHRHLCKMLREAFNVDIDMSKTKTTSQFFKHGWVLKSIYPTEGDGEGSPPDRTSYKRFIVKIQSGLEYSRYDPHKEMSLYDQTRSLEIWFRNPQIYHIVNECGILGANQLSTKKIYCWASFKNGGKVLCLHTENLPPVQTW